MYLPHMTLKSEGKRESGKKREGIRKKTKERKKEREREKKCVRERGDSVPNNFKAFFVVHLTTS